jgi:hypothetical protein
MRRRTVGRTGASVSFDVEEQALVGNEWGALK